MFSIFSIFFIFFFVSYSIYNYFSKRNNGNRSQTPPSHEPISGSTVGHGELIKGPYDVFLSFSGEDVRKGFLSHLHKALKDKGLHVFKDDQRLEIGKSIGPELLKAIDDSKVAIVVFSKNYASSSWCLDELIKIVDTEIEIVIPVFYDVSASDIRKQKNAVEQALAKLQTRDEDKMEKWKKALTKAANFSGCDVANTANGDESECIKDIVVKVFEKLKPAIPNARKDLVGIDWRMDKVISMLRLNETNTVRMVGIWGMGGVGKTTIASNIFYKLSNSYNASCFLQIDEGDRCDDKYLKQLQEKLISEILKSENLSISHTDNGISMIKDKLRSMKVLIVVDNAYHKEQLTALAMEHGTFGIGSRIIITTRDNHLLYRKVDEQYKVNLLNEDEGMQLFCWHAFKASHPCDNFVDLSREAVDYADGLPLALKVLGSLLEPFGSTENWLSLLRKLNNVPLNKIDSILKLSYEALDDMEKRLFLCVACFFQGSDKDKVMMMLDCLGLHPQSGITLLIAKSLLAIDERNRLNMHDLVQEMGRNIARTDDNYSGSMQWEKEKIVEVLNGKGDFKKVEAIVLMKRHLQWGKLNNFTHIFMVIKRIFQRGFKLNISNDVLMMMTNLRLLVFDEYIDCSQAPKDLPSELECLCWFGYPWGSLPESFQGRTLVGLILQASSIVKLISKDQRFSKLKIMDLSYSQNIRCTPDFSQIPCLEVLILNNCWNLLEVDPSFGVHKILQTVDLKTCRKLKELPKRLHMKSLRCLNLGGCENLEEFPEIDEEMTALEELDLSGSGIRVLPQSIRNLSGLRTLNLSDCKYLGFNQRDATKSSFMEALKQLENTLEQLFPNDIFGEYFGQA